MTHAVSFPPERNDIPWQSRRWAIQPCTRMNGLQYPAQTMTTVFCGGEDTDSPREKLVRRKRGQTMGRRGKGEDATWLIFRGKLGAWRPMIAPRLVTFGVRRARTDYPSSEFGMLDAHDCHARRVCTRVQAGVRSSSSSHCACHRPEHTHTPSLSRFQYLLSLQKLHHPLPDVNQTRVKLHAFGFWSTRLAKFVICRVSPTYVFNQSVSSCDNNLCAHAVRPTSQPPLLPHSLGITGVSLRSRA